ncbi:MAG TPA: hypothetical protein VGM23_01505, partial [Armatimonadota bacterium]
GCGIGLYVTQGQLFLALPYLVDRQSSASEALSFSWNVCATRFWLFLLFAFLITFLSWIGMYGCCIGYIFTLGFFPIAQAVAYERGFGVAATATATVPPYNLVPPPPYVPRVEDPTYKPEE